MKIVAVGLSILVIACGTGEEDRRAAELACQQRLVAALQGPPPAQGMARIFDAARTRFSSLSPEGCNERQLHTARIMARLTGQIAETLRRLGERPWERQLSPEENMHLRELQSSIEQFDHRRRRLIEELRQMQTQDR